MISTQSVTMEMDFYHSSSVCADIGLWFAEDLLVA